jgi:hypothetical protein
MGSQRNITPKKMIMIRPNQKDGMACPSTERDRAIRSIQVLGRMAARTPRGMARMTANIKEQTPRVMVTPMRSRIISGSF